MGNQKTNIQETYPSTYKSLISLLIVFISLFIVAFFHLEERRQGYGILKLNRELKARVEKRRLLEIKRLKALRPQKIEKEIQAKTDFNPAGFHQIIHLSLTETFEKTIDQTIDETIDETKVSKNRNSRANKEVQL